MHALVSTFTGRPRRSDDSSSQASCAGLVPMRNPSMDQSSASTSRSQPLIGTPPPFHPAAPSSSSSSSPIAPPPQAHYSSMQARDDELTDFFGGRRFRVAGSSAAAPPPYRPRLADEESEKLPSYTECWSQEPATVARYLFYYGFFFPLFWIIGIVFLFSPLRASPDWESGKTQEEKDRIMKSMRAEECKWARRCLYAFVLEVLVLAVVIVAVCVVKFR